VKLLTLARDLQRRKARERSGQFVAEGVRTVEELLASPIRLTGVLIGHSAMHEPRVDALRARAAERGVATLEVSDAEFASAADTDAPQGVLAIGTIPPVALPPASPITRWLVLDALQDPGNLGTIIRTAAALGVDATIVLPGTVDPWNAKVVRGAMGTLFRHPVIAMTWEACAAACRDADVTVWAAAADGDTLGAATPDATARVPARLALVVGNEGAGVSPTVLDAASRRVAIPMAPDVESLNAAVATGILLFALRPS
jgi:TrmH family RNA methyltransferase